MPATAKTASRSSTATDILIVQNYVAADGGLPNRPRATTDNGIEIRTSRNIAIGGEGEDGSSLGNYIVRNANDGVEHQGQ